MPSSLAFLTQSYAALSEAVRGIDEPGSWQPTGCLGWSVRDLTAHCWADAQRALVALHTPTDAAADVDAVSYWRPSGNADAQGAAAGRRFTRVMASMFLDWGQLRGAYLETADAAVRAAAGPPPEAVVTTQGHAIEVGDLLSTLALEATVHHLDLVRNLDGVAGPPWSTLALTREVVDGLTVSMIGHSLPESWSHEQIILIGTGRAEPTAEQANELAFDPQRLPLCR